MQSRYFEEIQLSLLKQPIALFKILFIHITQNYAKRIFKMHWYWPIRLSSISKVIYFCELSFQLSSFFKRKETII